MQSLKEQKTGDSFVITYSLPIEFGAVVAAVESQIKTSSYKIVESLTVEALPDTDDATNWQISATPLQTANWPASKLLCDIKHITVDGSVIHTETFIIPVEKAITL